MNFLAIEFTKINEEILCVCVNEYDIKYDLRHELKLTHSCFNQFLKAERMKLPPATKRDGSCK